MKKIGIIIFLLLCAEGCFLFKGSLYRNSEKVILTKDNPNYYAKDSKEAPGEFLGMLPLRAGDTVKTIGYYSGGVAEYASYLIIANQKEVYIHKADVLNQDDQLYMRLGSKFRESFSEDEWAWQRAVDYIKSHTKAPIEIANENLIKTKSIPDSTALGYLVTRVVQRSQVEYEVICKSPLSGPNPTETANRMAFYMVTGREYNRNN